MKKLIFIVMLGALLTNSCYHSPSVILFKSAKYTVYNDSVVQPPYKAVAISPNKIRSDYVSPVTKNVSSLIRFKFSINSRDNEMASGHNHMVTFPVGDSQVVTGPIRFGEQFIDTAGIPIGKLPYNTKWTVKLDMTRVLKAFREKGYFTLFNGNKLYKNDFKGVYIAGSTEPLSWDFENLHNKKGLQLTDNNHDGIYEVTLLLHPKKEIKKVRTWKLTTDISRFPKYQSDQLLVDALYNMSLEDMVKDIRPDSTFMAGKEWTGVWTRDISYSIILSLAAINPEIAKKSLMRKVEKGHIIQDTGTGGSWPVSTDREVWAIAAWEIYKVTGDKKWLARAFEIIRNSVENDQQVAFDKKTGLMYGESSFLDWREQTYPKWMDPVDIYESKNLGTNAVHFETRQVLSEMATILRKPAAAYQKMADRIRSGLNKYLWMNDKGYYGQYLYGKYYPILSPRSEALGESLCVLFGVANPEQQKKIIANTPVTEFGIPCIFPEIPDIPPYHNNAVWPFVESYWALASAKAGNETSVTRALAAIYRQAALFLTNKENMVAKTGDYKGTAINSDRQLWSVAGDLAMVYKLFIGMDFRPEGIQFKPFVPRSYTGEKKLTGFKYRNMLLNITVKGYGNAIRSFSIDGKESDDAFLPGDLKGEHNIRITLDDRNIPSSTITLKTVDFSPPTVEYTISHDTVHFADTSKSYRVYINGKYLGTPVKHSYTIADQPFLNEYMFLTKEENGYGSFAGIPLVIMPPKGTYYVEAEKFAPASGLPYKGYSGKGFIEITKKKNTNYKFNVTVDQEGTYAIDFRYANGTGPVNTDNNCAIRTLKCNGVTTGTVVFPQRGKNEWSNWGYSNALMIHLKKGENNFILSFEPFDENMDGKINIAMLDRIRLVKMREENGG